MRRTTIESAGFCPLAQRDQLAYPRAAASGPARILAAHRDPAFTKNIKNSNRWFGLFSLVLLLPP
jgi:hypothetical protein